MKNQKIFAASGDAVTERELANLKTAYDAAAEGIVLLKNDGALPVKTGKIALYGAGASQTVKGGTGSGEVNERHAVTILEGMENAGFEITTRRWIDTFEQDCVDAFNEWRSGAHLGFDIINDLSETFLAPSGRVISDEDIALSGCDTAVYVVSRQAGEGADKKIEKGEFSLRPSEIESIETMASSYKKSILVINSGSYMDIGNLDEMVSAVIYYCQQGMQGGNAFADILSGKISPSGRLTDTWARTYRDVPFGYEYSYLGDPARQYYYEGIYVGYRYYDTFGKDVRYPFGFGLSYTDFDISLKDVTPETLVATVRNTGSCSGKETVQLYACCPDGVLKKEYKRLIGFSKTSVLAPGESEDVSIPIRPDYLASYSEKDASWILEKGDYVLLLGRTPVAALRNAKTQIIRKCRNITSAGISEIKAPAKLPVKFSGKVIAMPDYGTETTDYRIPPICSDPETGSVMKSLSTSELIDVCVGTGISGMIESRGIFAPGTVGRTTHKLFDKGLVNLNLADGPAGLRLLRLSALNAKGKLKFVDGNYMISFLNLLPESFKKLFASKPGDRMLYQFTTAFPVGTALAQTWNEALCERVGRAVSSEMSEYAITYWLAPAVNIHKNPLCGRNFEYMSEDPFLTGKISAAICRGVQSVDGNYATVKHFACNNSEEKREHSDSILNERALREIYLRAFEITVREGGVKSVMTSYNKLNGTYTPNSRDLCTDVLRCEWGFDGVVMTDWYSTLGDQADAALCIKSGNDLIMPGLPTDKSSIRKALKKGTITNDDLWRAAANVVRSIVHSGVSKYR